METLSILDCGVATEQGSRPHQEDRYTCIQPQDFPAIIDRRLAYFAVYDGHGGPDVSEHASKTVHMNLISSPAFQTGDYEQAIHDAINAEEKQLYDGFARGGNDAATSGSTVALVLVDLTNGELVVANLGDSHIVLGEQIGAQGGFSYKPKRLTKADNPDGPEERARIEDAGGRVRHAAGQARIELRRFKMLNHPAFPSLYTGTINMSRALGDLQYKKPLNAAKATGDFISSRPHILRFHPDPNILNVLVIATDGVWFFIDDEPLFEFIWKQIEEGHGAASIAGKIVQKCASKDHADNTTCIVLLLGSKNSPRGERN
ncbi:protein serine/threonine phosphatase [Emydomyces testavorans]|uniref:Protein serine/threonine phosphatase n=1 Tax=Emydomyces testavorans TaxID=2070801 RepID=A0AAF0ILB4_9EURO|nr:protein serine/threonine phosphatase [Emydomyces testavorans]